MERVLTPEERIRRAEEIYQRRKEQNGIRVTSSSVNAGKRNDFSLIKKMLLQIAICLVVYFIFYLMQHTDYLFSKQVMDKTKEILSYDINLQSLYTQATQKLEEIFQKEEKNEGTKPNGENKVTEENKEVNQEENKEDKPEEQPKDGENPLTDEAIGGANEEGEKGISQQETKENLSQMEIDGAYVKDNFSMIKPLTGTITSRFGHRDPTTPTVPKEHTGLDIAANSGTVIIATMDGVVELASSSGDYGNHLKITNQDVMTLYAHCKTLYVKEGETVKQGQQIAEVGATGNVTGAHLHFEIRREGRYVNPELVLDFSL